ncbi:MAG: hypothetical protein ISEC1_P1725 [Thiomicrorhabdus sp.]|nr:MAG: hypothetical protein ISEC1_P1725 [Thiomicrorhabdus sp.]
MYYLSLQLKSLSIFVVVLLLAGCSNGPQLKPFEPPVYPPSPEPARFIYERSLIGTADVQSVTTQQRFKSMATGRPVRTSGLVKPYDVAVFKGRVYVSDTMARSITMFDIPGKRFVQFGRKGPGGLQKPIGLSVDFKGNVYVADNSLARIVVFDPEGKYLSSFGNKEELVRPTDVAVTADGKYAYVVDTGGIESTSHHLVKYDLATGKMLQKIGTRGSGDGGFNFPLMVDIDSKGRIYVLDSGNFRVQRFSAEGKFEFSFGKVGNRLGMFSRPKGLAIDNDDNIYVMDASFANFQIFNDKGELLLFIGERSSINQPGKFALAAGVAVDEDGRVYAVDQIFRKVEVFRPYGLKKTSGYAAVLPVDR